MIYTKVWRNATPDRFYVPFTGYPFVDYFKEFVAKDVNLLHSVIQLNPSLVIAR